MTNIFLNFLKVRCPPEPFSFVLVGTFNAVLFDTTSLLLAFDTVSVAVVLPSV